MRMKPYHLRYGRPNVPYWLLVWCDGVDKKDACRQGQLAKSIAGFDWMHLEACVRLHWWSLRGKLLRKMFGNDVKSRVEEGQELHFVISRWSD